MVNYGWFSHSNLNKGHSFQFPLQCDQNILLWSFICESVALIDYFAKNLQSVTPRLNERVHI